MNPQALPALLANSMGQGIPDPQQVTQASPNYQPSLAPQAATPMPDKSPETMMHLHNALKRRGINPASISQISGGQQPASAPMAQQPVNQPVPLSEAELIIKALSSRLGLLGKHESAVRDHLFPHKENDRNNPE